jgi:hypothetical protein
MEAIRDICLERMQQVFSTKIKFNQQRSPSATINQLTLDTNSHMRQLEVEIINLQNANVTLERQLRKTETRLTFCFHLLYKIHPYSIIVLK